MSDLVQKIADDIISACEARGVAYLTPVLLTAIIRQSLGSTQERGEAVAWGVQKTGEDGVWFVSDSRFTAQHYATAYAHRVSDGNPDQAVIPLYTTPDAGRVAELEREQQISAALSRKVAALEQQLTESRELVARAYGLLWHVNAGIDAPWGTPSLTPERAAMESRKVLRDMLTSEQRGDGINAARDHMKALAAEKEQK